MSFRNMIKELNKVSADFPKMIPATNKEYCGLPIYVINHGYTEVYYKNIFSEAICPGYYTEVYQLYQCEDNI